MKTEYIEKILKPFNETQKNTIIAALHQMETYGVNPVDIIQYNEKLLLSQIKEISNIDAPKRRGKPLCAICGSPMRVLPVNDGPTTIVGGQYTHVYLCVNSLCMHSNYVIEGKH